MTAVIGGWDKVFLRRAFAVARRSRERGNYPFGCVFVSERGEVLLEAENNVISAEDRVGHADVNLVCKAARRWSSRNSSPRHMRGIAEPCPMRSGALYRGGVGRLVYAMGKKLAGEVMREMDEGPWLLLGCREVFAAGRGRSKS